MFFLLTLVGCKDVCCGVWVSKSQYVCSAFTDPMSPCVIETLMDMQCTLYFKCPVLHCPF